MRHAKLAAMSDANDSKDPQEVPPRRAKNLWAAAIIVAGIIIGIILIIRGDPAPNLPGSSHTEPQRGLFVIFAAFVIGAIVYFLNNRHHLKAKADKEESEEFD
jgi:uncharacterized integral membrane protein